jgi:hypothetical protein
MLELMLSITCFESGDEVRGGGSPVLSKGGDIGADQLADTSADPKIRCGSAGRGYGLGYCLPETLYIP